jgi:hypothetical protein
VVEQAPGSRYPAGLVAVSVTASGWALLYALYRGYDGFGGTIGLIGTPASRPSSGLLPGRDSPAPGAGAMC